MAWQVDYHPDVADDLFSMGKSNANKALDVIEKRIENGEPDKAGKPLRKELAGCRRIRTGDIRIVYKVFEKEIQVLVVAVGMRRNEEVYKKAGKRKPKELPSPKTHVKKSAVKKKAVRRVK